MKKEETPTHKVIQSNSYDNITIRAGILHLCISGILVNEIKNSQFH